MFFFYRQLVYPLGKLKILSLHARHCITDCLKRDFGSQYTLQGAVDSEDFHRGTIIPGDWRVAQQLLELLRCGSGSTTIGNNIRTQYMNYFNAEGAVQWQSRMANV